MDKTKKMGIQALANMIIVPIAAMIKEGDIASLLKIALSFVSVVAIAFGIFCAVVFLNSFIRNTRHRSAYRKH